MKKKIISLLLTLCLAASLLPTVGITARAASSVWDGTSTTAFAGGSGTSADPYQIATAEQLAKLSGDVQSGTTYQDCYFKLTDDIVLNNNVLAADGTPNAGSFTAWTPIGTDMSHSFRGSFNGNGKTVSGIYINASTGDLQGLFGYSLGTIENLGVVDSYINGNSIVGGVVGFSNGLVSNCSNTGTIVGSAKVGGVVGLNSGSVSNCSNTGGVTGINVGGVVGENSGTVSNCFNAGTITGSGSGTTDGSGGVVGCAHGEAGAGEVSYCSNTGAVTSSSTNTGGVVGYSSSDVSYCYNAGPVNGGSRAGGVGGYIYGGTVSSCYNTAAVTGSNYAGGVVGYADGDGAVSNCYNTGAITGIKVGGVAAVIGTSDVLNCYNTGAINGSSYAGGVVAMINSGLLSNCYYDKQMCPYGGINGSDFAGKAVGKLTSEMTGAQVFSDAAWVTAAGLYPRLAGTDTTDTAYVSALPISLSSADTARSVTADFTLGTLSGASWSASDNMDGVDVVTISGTNVSISRQSIDIQVQLTVTYGTASRTIGLTVAAVSFLPTTTVTAASLSNDTGSSGSDFITTTANQTISGTLSAALASDESVQVSFDGGSSWSDADTVTVGSAAWSTTAALSGSNTFQARVVNSYGASVPYYTHTYTIDTAAPTVSAVAVPADGSYMAGGNLVFRVTYDEAVTVTGTPQIALTIGSTTVYADYTATGSTATALNFTYTVLSGQTDADGVSLGVLSLNGGTIKDTAGNDASLTLISVGSTAGVLVDTTAPTVSAVAVPAAGSYMAGGNLVFRVTYDEAVTVAGTPQIALTIGSTTVFADYTATGSTATALNFTDTVLSGQTDADGVSLGALSLNGGTIKDTAGNDASLTLNSVGSTVGVLVDTAAPVPGDSGAITIGSVASSTVTLSWTAAADDLTAQANLLYRVYDSTGNNLITVSDAETNGTAFGGWTAGMTSATVTGLSASTEYYFTVIVKDTAGNKSVYTACTANTTAASVGGGGSLPSTTNDAAILINGASQTAGTLDTSINSDGRTQTTVTIDADKLLDILEDQETGTKITIPISGGSDIAAGVLTGAVVDSMEQNGATLVVQTETATYTLPTDEINISATAAQFGESVSLADITVTVAIAEPSDETVSVVENAAESIGSTLVVPAVEFTVTCTYGGQSVELTSFGAYVERTITIPDGVDPEEVTTAVVVDPDGTVHQVPTKLEVIDGTYYAVISSLTNSVYAIIFNQVAFSDVADHWAKNAINDMGSRLIISGIGDNTYEPDRSITRAEFATIMVRALGLTPGAGESGFDDVSAADWYSGYVITAASHGIINGYDNENFGPNDTITREQALTMIARAMNLTGLDTELTDSEVSGLLGAFTDGAIVSDYAKDSVAACLQSEITSGTSGTTLSPKANITRAEVAVLVERMLQKAGLI